MSYGVGGRRDSDPVLLWLWCRLAATVPIEPLAWEPPYATGAALEKAKRQKKKKNHKSVVVVVFDHRVQWPHVGSQSPDQGFNPGHSSESTES